MALRSRFLLGFLLLSTIGVSIASNPAQSPKPSASTAIADLKEAIVKVLGLQAEDLKISGFDVRDALVGQSVAYEFDIEIDKKILPFKLLEDVNRWEFVDLPIFRAEGLSRSADGKELTEKRSEERDLLPVLAPFQLAGPMELWIQDGDDMRISLPHDVDAGILKKVILAEGAVVTVSGARSVSLRTPLELPLPLNRTQKGFAAGLITLADRLRLASLAQQKPLLSLRIVGPTSLTSPPSLSSVNKKLKLKRLAPGLVELSSPSKMGTLPDEVTLLTPDRFSTMWPLTSINGTNANLRGFEELLSSVLGTMNKEGGSFRLLKAEASAQTYVKMGFEAEKELKEGDVNWDSFPAWRTRPETVKMHFEVLAKVDGEKVVPERVVQVKPVEVSDSFSANVGLMGNMTASQMPVVYPPPSPFLL